MAFISLATAERRFTQVLEGKQPVAAALGDCMDYLPLLPNGSIDMVLCDLPYGTTQAPWDSVLPLEELWKQYKRITKAQGAIVLFCAQPFTSVLICSNLPMYKYSWIWKKNNFSNPLQAKKQPLRLTEDIAVFCQQPPPYYAQGIVKVDKLTRQGKTVTELTGNQKRDAYTQEYTNWPRNILEFARDAKSKHPTQKPIALLEYLINTYSLPGELILDNTAGVFSTGVAAINTERRSILMERDERYYPIGRERLAAALAKITPADEQQAA